MTLLLGDLYGKGVCPDNGTLTPSKEFDFPPMKGDWAKVLDHLYGSQAAATYPTAAALPTGARTFYNQAFYGTVWFNTLHIIPSPVDFGNMTQDESIDVEVFNSYLDTVETLSVINEEGTADMELSEPVTPPHAFQPLEYQIYTLSISATGAPDFDATYTFIFTDGSPKLEVTGTRVVAVTIGHNWDTPVVDSFKWRTNILTTRNGIETRSKTRHNPRRETEFTYTLKRTAAVRLRAAMVGWQYRIVAVPMWQSICKTTAPSLINTAVVYVTTVGAGFIEGGLALLRGGTEATVEILTVASDSLTLKYDLSSTWGTGVDVIPVRKGYLSQEVSHSLLAPDIAQIVTRFELLDEDYISAAIIVADSYRGLNIFPFQPERTNPLTQSFSSTVDRLDNQIGNPVILDLVSPVGVTLEFPWYTKSREEMEQMYAWDRHLSGNLSPFFAPTWESDVSLLSLVSSSGLDLEVSNIGYSLFISQRFGIRDIRVRLHTGEVFYRRIVASSEVDATTETLTIDSPFLVDVAPSDVLMIDFLYLVRLESEGFEITHYNPVVAKFSANFKVVPDDL